MWKELSKDENLNLYSNNTEGRLVLTYLSNIITIHKLYIVSNALINLQLFTFQSIFYAQTFLKRFFISLNVMSNEIVNTKRCQVNVIR